MDLIFYLITAIGGGLGCYLVMRPKLKKISKYNEDIERQNEELTKTNQILQERKSLISQDLDFTVKKHDVLLEENKRLSQQIEQTHKNVQSIYDNALANIQDKLEIEAVKMSDYYQDQIKLYEKEYTDTMAELTKEMAICLESRQKELVIAEQRLEELRSKIETAIAANLREEEKKSNLAFYALDLTDLDVQEVDKIKSITPYLRNSRPLNKAIWEAYYRNPTTDLVNRVIKGKSGIYKITCLLDEKKYIGQAVDLAERFKQHVKCGVGIDAPRNKLYQAMEKLGLENFTFEVIEYCPATQLNEREKYWIDFYKSNIYGFNMTAGNSTEKKEKK